MPGRLPQGQRPRPLHAGRHRRTGSRSPAWATAATWDVDRPGPAARGRAGPHRSLRRARHDRRRRLVSLQRIVRLAADARQRRDEGDGVRHRLRPQPLLQLHVLPRRSRERRPVPAGGSPVRDRREGDPSPAEPLGRPRRAEHVRRCSCGTTTSRRSVSTTPQRAQPLDTTREDAVLQTSGGGVRCRTRWSGRRGCGRSPALRVDGYRFDVDADNPANSGTEYAGIVSPKGGVVVGPFDGHRVLRRTPASASTATTRAARRSRSIRRPASRPSA